jgi:hypothetical protein
MRRKRLSCFRAIARPYRGARVLPPTALLVAIALAASDLPVLSRSLQIEGAAGYLSEWEIKGAATAPASPEGEYLGRVIWTHIGLCSVNGPSQKSGDIRFRIHGTAPSARIDATMTFDGNRCTYSGGLSGGSTGHMDCSDAKGVPLAISIREMPEK